MGYIKMETTVIYFLGIFLFLQSCTKQNTEPKLPPETHVGAYTIGFKVDGKVYTAKGKGGLLATQYINYGYFSSDSTFYIGAASRDNAQFDISLNFKCFQLNTPCQLSVFPFNAFFLDASNGTLPGDDNVYNTTGNYKGSVTVKYFDGTFYPGNFGTYVSGTFEMDAVNGHGKVIHITDGRFDAGL